MGTCDNSERRTIIDERRRGTIGCSHALAGGVEVELSSSIVLGAAVEDELNKVKGKGRRKGQPTKK
jgi:hypothetical protein